MLITRVRILLLTIFTSLVAGCGGGGGSPGVVPRPPAALPTLGLTEVASATAPMFLTAPAGDARLFIVERAGRIRIVQNGALLGTPFLDIGARVSVTGEGGLLSLAFDPQYADNGLFYYYYTDLNNNIVIARGSVSADPNLANPQGELALLAIPHPSYTNHYGGLLGFGPDGFLYFGTGDGGGAGDPQRNAQNLDSLLGKLLRIDVNGATLARRYQIPPTNPFVAQAGRRPEIWALGLRNPWRFAFDSGRLYIADVGQSRREEINIASVATAALNYGWNVMEGGECFGVFSCNVAGLALPTFEYLHAPSNPNCSVTGGAVYRGRAIPELAGHYFYSDYCAGFLRSFVYDGRTIVQNTDWPIDPIGNIVSFGTGGDGELYLLSAGGKIYRIVRTSAPAG
ncbi:MAG: PQQ-dependent sugar dehydrogenase [Pseudomonadota bacterium]